MPTQTRMDEFADWGTEVVFGRAHGFRAFIMRCLLRFASLLFFVLVKVRLFLFRRRIKTVRNLGTLVISVGNITAGGTGKTPVVELLSRTLAQRGRTVSILTRGYKSGDLDTPQTWTGSDGRPVENLPKIASDGTTRYLGPLHAGDEPFMLARNLDGVSVLVDKDRVKSGIFAIEQLGADTLILDDGMQYLKLAHELDIVLVDCGAPFGTGALLPRGTMREPRSSLKRADYIILTKSDGTPQDELIRRIRRYNKSADIIVTNHGPKHFENVFTGERKPLDFVHDKWVACMSGIARPENFENAVEQLGGKVEIRRRYPDHYWFDQSDLDAFVERCADRAMDIIVTTEKDAVRFLKPGEMDVPIYFLRIEIDILEGREHWDRMIERIVGLNTPQPAPQWSHVL